MAAINKLWIPSGRTWDMHVMHMEDRNAGNFLKGGNKLVIHTTESSWQSVLAMENVLDRKDAAPHFVIGGRFGTKLPTVIQMVPLNKAGRALGNDSSDGYQTNRAGRCIQIEICGFARETQTMSDWHLKAIANLVELIRHRVDIPLVAPIDFSKPRRLTDAQWTAAEGIFGHSMCPDNDHWDPGRFREGRLIQLCKAIPKGGYKLT
jgi:hypothetical protein